MIFVFGSNEAGHHGSGAAKTARLTYGAIRGIGFGHFGESFAIPTKDYNIHTLPLNKIEYYVFCFLVYAEMNQGMNFLVTRIGCGFAGYKDENIAPLFQRPHYNCIIPIQWKEWMSHHHHSYHDEGEILV